MRKAKPDTTHRKKALMKDKKDDDGEDRPSAAEKKKVVVESSADPESGLFHRGEHRKCFAYEAHTFVTAAGMYWRRRYLLEMHTTALHSMRYLNV